MIHFNVTGSRRKELVKAIAELSGHTARYLGVPGCAYGIGPYTVDRNGGMTWTDEVTDSELEYLIEALCEAGFEAEVEPAEEPTERPEEKTECTTIQLPALSEHEQENLMAIITAKAPLLRRAIGTDNLGFTEKDGKLVFPWFGVDITPDETHAYTELVAKLCGLAKSLKRVTSKERTTANEKYAFRCFLLRLGFIGDDYKTDRKVLLRNMSGNSAYKAGKTSC